MLVQLASTYDTIKNTKFCVCTMNFLSFADNSQTHTEPSPLQHKPNAKNRISRLGENQNVLIHQILHFEYLT